MKDNDVIILGIVALGMIFGFFGFLAYLKKVTEPTTATPIIETTTPITEPTQPIYVHQAGVVETEEVRSTRPHMINHSLNEANKWYEIKLPVDAVTWQLKTRGNYDLSYSFEPSHSTYITLTRGSVLTENTAPNMSIGAIYVMCETAGVIAELEVWRNHG